MSADGWIALGFLVLDAMFFAGVVLVCVNERAAPMGHEDENGFHHDRDAEASREFTSWGAE